MYDTREWFEGYFSLNLSFIFFFFVHIYREPFCGNVNKLIAVIIVIMIIIFIIIIIIKHLALTSGSVFVFVSF